MKPASIVSELDEPLVQVLATIVKLVGEDAPDEATRVAWDLLNSVVDPESGVVLTKKQFDAELREADIEHHSRSGSPPTARDTSLVWHAAAATHILRPLWRSASDGKVDNLGAAVLLAEGVLVWAASLTRFHPSEAVGYQLVEVAESVSMLRRARLRARKAAGITETEAPQLDGEVAPAPEAPQLAVSRWKRNRGAGPRGVSLADDFGEGPELEGLLQYRHASGGSACGEEGGATTYLSKITCPACLCLVIRPPAPLPDPPPESLAELGVTVMAAIGTAPGRCAWTPVGADGSSAGETVVAPTRARQSASGITFHACAPLTWSASEGDRVILCFRVRARTFRAYVVPPRPVVVLAGQRLRVSQTESASRASW